MIITRRFRDKGWKSSEKRTKHQATTHGNHKKTNKSANPQTRTKRHTSPFATKNPHTVRRHSSHSGHLHQQHRNHEDSSLHKKLWRRGARSRGCRKEPWGTQKRASNSNIDHIGYAKHEAIWFCGSSTADFLPPMDYYPKYRGPIVLGLMARTVGRQDVNLILSRHGRT